MCLRFVFLLITRTASWLRLQRRQPRRPKLNWADRALLATLLGAIPKARRQGAAAAGHPGHHAALAPGHRPPPLGRQVHARQGRPAGDPPEHQGPGPPAGPREPRVMWSRGLCGAGDVLLLVVVSVSRVVSRIAGWGRPRRRRLSAARRVSVRSGMSTCRRAGGVGTPKPAS